MGSASTVATFSSGHAGLSLTDVRCAVDRPMTDCTHEVGPDGPHGVKGFKGPPLTVDHDARSRFERIMDIVADRRKVDSKDRSTVLHELLTYAAVGIAVESASPKYAAGIIERIRAKHQELVNRVWPGAEVRK